MLSETVTLTHSQINHLGATGIDIVPAQGAGKVIQPISALAVFKPGNETGYDTLGDDDLLLSIDGVSGCLVANSNSFLNSSVNRAVRFASAVANVDLSGGPTDLATLANKALQLWNWSGVEYTAGHADGTLDVTVLYTIIDV